MNNRTIRSKVISYFVGMSLLLSLVFGALALIFSYAVEDQVFQALLIDEQQLIEEQIAHGQTPSPRLTFISFYAQKSQLPEPILRILNDEPQRIEFPGVGQEHFHLLAINGGYLVAEVSEHLAVRKLKGEMLSIFMILLSLGLFAALLLALTSLKLAKRMLKPLDDLMGIVANAPVEKLPTHFAERFAHGEIGQFAQTLENALTRIRAFVTREQEFTRDVSHELRTPIAVINGAITLLKNTAMSSEQQKLVQRIEKANVQTTQSIEGLLVLAREESDEKHDTALLPLIERVALAHVDLIENKPVELVINIKPHVHLALSEPALTLIVSNLIKNAFVHIEQGKVLVEYDTSREVLIIQDTGPGIEKAVLESPFKPGIKGQSSKGTGLGLAIVKRVCDKMNIAIELESSSAGTCIELGLCQL
ncbi:two-component system sensor protein [Pseudoalteromonas luteoviolacea B = ATCC 29581]|nr:two-component system sensor protein [Pseudoalteromonas luteoviolacea B = ATCC 29581]